MPIYQNEASLIYQTQNGKVLRCACCGRLEIHFGNIAIAEPPSRFERLRKIVASIDLDRPASQTDSDRPIMLAVDGVRLSLRFTRAEAAELQELLDGTAAMLELEHLLDDTLSSEERS